MSKDVEMTEAAPAQTTETAQTKKPETNALLLADLKKHVQLFERSVSSGDLRFVTRVLRSLTNIRRRMKSTVLRQFIEFCYSQSEAEGETKKLLLQQISSIPAEAETETEAEPMDIGKSEEAKKPKTVLPEVEVYIRLLIVIFLLDKKQYQEAINASNSLVQRLQDVNRRTLNPLSARAYFYYSRSYELVNRLADIRSELLAFHRTASLRHNDDAQATLLNLLLRNYLAYNLYDQADKLLSKTQFKEESASNNEFARYLYYQGKIKSIQLDYTDAYRCLLGAMRKAPQNSARGFRLAVTKLACIVQCLIGEIPERSIFRQPGLKKALVPYLELVRAVRIGDLNSFHEVINKHAAVFHADKTYTLIQRLRHNVIKTGLRKINLSYSRISLEDIKTKLHLESVEDVEFIVAKAIRDGVISATIDHAGKFLQSKENIDVYSTQEPVAAFHRRITFCLNTHNDAVKAMRFPPDMNKPNSETLKERREREQEIAKNLADDEEDEF